MKEVIIKNNHFLLYATGKDLNELGQYFNSSLEMNESVYIVSSSNIDCMCSQV